MFSVFRQQGLATVALAVAASIALSPHPAIAALDAPERARAEVLAHALPWSATRTAADDLPHPLGVQTLGVEAYERKGAPPGERRARVYQHDHSARRTRVLEIDLVTDEVRSTNEIASPHLPLNAAERSWALERLGADASLLETLRDAQRRRGQLPFARLDELDVKASVFEPSAPGHPCAQLRCALLSLFDATRTVFAIEPIVRFADGAITTLDGAAAAER